MNILFHKMTYFVTQCAAVNTHCVPIKAPPQRYWFSEFIKATCQHHSAGSASSPPTTRPPRSLIVPFTPHTYLLYTGDRVVVLLKYPVTGVATENEVATFKVKLVCTYTSYLYKNTLLNKFVTLFTWLV